MNLLMTWNPRYEAIWRNNDDRILVPYIDQTSTCSACQFPQVMQRLYLCQYRGYRHVCLMPQCLLLALVDQYTWLMRMHRWVEMSISCINVETANGFKWDVILVIMNQQPCNCSHMYSIKSKYFSSNIKDTALLTKQTILTTQIAHLKECLI